MPSPNPAVSAARHRRRGGALLAIAAWQVWLWGTRAYNLVRDGDDFSAAFVAVHLILFAASFAMAGYLAVVGWRMRQEAADGASVGPSIDDDPVSSDRKGVPA